MKLSVAAAVLTAGVLGLTGCSTLQKSPPQDGFYQGELCTATPQGPLNCGPAEVSLVRGLAKVRVSDFVYDLTLDNGDVDVTLVHVRMLVDVFSARYTWDGPYLRFIDEERRTFYRVRFADPLAPARQSGTPDGGMG